MQTYCQTMDQQSANSREQQVDILMPLLRPVETPSSTDKYQKSGLNRQQSAILWDKLELLMQAQQPFLYNGLKLTELAEMLDVVPNHLSQIVNTHGAQPIAQLALESGFNSQNTFYNQFRKKTVQLPPNTTKEFVNIGTTPLRYSTP